MSIKVLIADDHAIVAQGLHALLLQRFHLVGSVREGHALVEAAERLSPDVVVTDISMPGITGLEAIRQIKKSKPDVASIVLTIHADPSLVAQALKAGASGYLLKTSAVEELEIAIRQVLQGRIYVTSLIACDLHSLLMNGPGAGTVDLTPRQREVLELIVEGRTMKQAASLLGISPRTAESHKYAIMNALGCQTTADLIHYAVKMKAKAAVL
jgi:DNA-binding NarL/FixJ family response regulator